MYLLADFAFKELNYNKILDKWLKVSKKTEPFNDTKAYHRQMMLQSMKNRSNLSLLKKDYKDAQGRSRRVVTGMVQSKDKPDRLIVSNLVGNPFSRKDTRFKGAMKSIEKKAGKRHVEIDAITPAVDKLYNDTIGYKRI